jgi:hypothetical protein
MLNFHSQLGATSFSTGEPTTDFFTNSKFVFTKSSGLTLFFFVLSGSDLIRSFLASLTEIDCTNRLDDTIRSNTPHGT